MMGEKWEKVLSKAIGVKPIMINSALVSAQNRQRLYWTNIGLEPMGLFGDLETTIEQPKDKGVLLKDILESEVDVKYFLSDKGLNRIASYNNFEKSIDNSKKSLCLAAGYYKQGRDNQLIVHNMMPRSSTSGKGGSGHLTRQDGKTYCLDTGNTNAIELREVKQINPSKESGGKQPYMQNRVFDINGINPSLTTLWNGGNLINTKKIRRLTPIECERLQTVADNYTNHVSDSQRYKMLGNGWTVDVIVHILSYIK
jgi:DNA (cytosine-5)-methyltransferase 3A